MLNLLKAVSNLGLEYVNLMHNDASMARCDKGS